jgi:hypothetical protein
VRSGSLPARLASKPVFARLARAALQVIAVCKSADLLLMVLDATKPLYHKQVAP